MLGGSSVGREGLELENGLGEVVRRLSVASPSPPKSDSDRSDQVPDFRIS